LAEYGSANNIFKVENQTAVALANLASATTADRNTIATLIKTMQNYQRNRGTNQKAC